jgi:hypothetical protein
MKSLATCCLALLLPLPLLADANAAVARGNGICQFILQDFELSRTSEASANMAVSNLLKQLQGALDFTTRTNLHIRVRVFGRFEEFRDYSTAHRGPRDGEYAGVALSNLAGYYSPRTREVVTWAQKDRSFFGNSLLHECTHAILNQQFEKVPIWLNEGCAVNFSFPKYMRDRSDKMLLISQWLLLQKYLNEGSLPNLRTFLNLSDRDFRALQGERSYPVSWSLFQLLMSTPERRRAMNQMLKGYQKQDDSKPDCAMLLEKSYPGGLAKMEKDWREWITRGVAGMRWGRLVEPK